MIKLLFMLRRRNDISMEEFIERYEHGHARLGERHVPNALHYTRRFIAPVAGIFTSPEEGFDVMTELWFQDQNSFDEAMTYLRHPDVSAEIAADEAELFDRASTRVYLIREEHVSPPGNR